MRRRSRRTSSGQLRLFPPTAPLRWTNVPIEARERVVALLSRLLRQHARTHRRPEVCDE
jgi:hypothetical protein